jgi:hypothetical protein
MKAEIRLPQPGVDAEIQAFDINGKPITAQIGRIVIEPLFNQPQQRVNVLFGRTYIESPPDEGQSGDKPEELVEEEVGRFVVQISGHNGRAAMTDRTKRVKPLFETKRTKAKSVDDKPPTGTPKGGNKDAKASQDAELAELPTTASAAGN